MKSFIILICAYLVFSNTQIANTHQQEAYLITKGIFDAFGVQNELDINQVFSKIESNQYYEILQNAVNLQDELTEESILEGVRQIGVALQQIPDSIDSLEEQTQETIIISKIFNNLLEQLRNPLRFHFQDNVEVVINGVNISQDLGNSLLEWESENYEQYGRDLGTVMIRLMLELENLEAVIHDQSVILLIFDGVLDGILDASGIKGQDIRQCIDGVNLMVIDFEESIRLLETGLPHNVVQSLQIFGDGLQHFPQALDQCKASIKEAAKLAKQLRELIKALQNPASFAFHIGIDLIVNGRDIYREIFTAVDDWKQGNWNDFGYQLGKAMYQIFVGLHGQQS
ncbi:unnamed protein product (macronuclear) [Paramecium tetraurelia]|uniref:Secreted protein n=1 Tax=Paramecium tetraurelia TaxID=5888 RepID=A0EA06_PARTE|nr:uncharacterized protein GSPATT00024854001 [Paramecium tetraurelia]CAK92123.1 unnamed protein product [Paramecium tetraurelia]|eukprot:XP_001459520.1 hypothetical protein (macronuclear) [Paramecium tetraurelia strain d4-2]